MANHDHRNTILSKRDMSLTQHELVLDESNHCLFPPTRYQGSKLKLLDWIWVSIEHLSFDSAIDLFGGTGSVAYLLKTKGKTTTFNDALQFNYQTGKALIENYEIRLSDNDMAQLFKKHSNCDYDNFIERTFKDIYFTESENRWLDIVIQNIHKLRNPYKKAIAFYSLFQACIAKRPYNLFHRANLYMRISDVKRSFGNKTTWEKPFEEHFRQAAILANRSVFDNGKDNRALNCSFDEVPTEADLVYIDTPYMNNAGKSVDYLEFYHFLEGLTEYEIWPERVTTKYKHKPYKRRPSPWCNRNQIHDAFDNVFSRFKDSILVVSYRNNGIPSPEELKNLLKRHKKTVQLANNTNYKYVLSKTSSSELLFIAE